jgi:hypothetical protein
VFIGGIEPQNIAKAYEYGVGSVFKDFGISFWRCVEYHRTAAIPYSWRHLSAHARPHPEAQNIENRVRTDAEGGDISEIDLVLPRPFERNHLVRASRSRGIK